MKDVQFTIDKIELYYQKTVDAWSKIENNSIQLPPNELFISKNRLENLLNKTKIIEYGGTKYFSRSNTLKINSSPNFNKNFKLLIEDINVNQVQNFEINIISENAKKIQRIHAIFEDHQLQSKATGKDLKFTPQYFTLHEGFIDHDTKITCYTDHQIFDRYHQFRVKDTLKKSNRSITIKELTGLKQKVIL